MMLLYENFRLALFSLKANKMRSLLTMLGIIIGISSVIAIMTVGDSLSGRLTDTMSGMGVNNIQVFLSTRPEFDESGQRLTADMIKYMDRDMIKELCKRFEGEIKAASLSIEVGGAQAKDENLYANVTVSAESFGSFILNDIELLNGRYFTEAETESASKVAIVSDKFVDNMFNGKTYDALGQTVHVDLENKSYNFTIVGVYEYVDQYSALGVTAGKNVRTNMYIPIETAVNITHDDRITYFNVMAYPEVDQNQLCENIKTFFDRKYYSNNEALYVEAFNMSSMLEEVTDLMNKLTLGIAVIAGIALLVGGIGVMNIMLVSITERTREIGTRKALGAPNSSIRLQFIIEAIVICLIGGLIGIFLGCALGMTLAKLMQCPVQPSVRGIIISITFSMAIGLFFGYYPANKAAKMDPIEALRYE